LVSRRTFEAMTGPKADFWLAQTVGVLVACIGSALVLAGKRNLVNTDIRVVAASTAGAWPRSTPFTWRADKFRRCISLMPRSRLDSSGPGSRAGSNEIDRPEASFAGSIKRQ
jgi:hypothetical protein